jgi:hypothetical protein
VAVGGGLRGSKWCGSKPPLKLLQSHADVGFIREKHMATKARRSQIADCDKIDDHTSLRGHKVLER